MQDFFAQKGLNNRYTGTKLHLLPILELDNNMQ